MDVKRSTAALGAAIGTAMLMATAIGSAQAPAAGGRGAGAGPAAPTVGSMLWPVFDANKDGSVTAAEIKTTFDAWYAAADTQNGGSVTQDQLGPALNAALGQSAAAAGAAAAGRGGFGGGRAAGPFVAGATTPGLNSACGGRSQQPTVPCPSDVQQMVAILPRTAPAKPLKPHKVLIFSRIPSAGYQHSSIPLAAKAVEELGKKTGAWTSDTSWDPAVFTDREPETVRRHLPLEHDRAASSTRPEGDSRRAEADARARARRRSSTSCAAARASAGIHATGDSYHSPCPNDDAGGRRRAWRRPRRRGQRAWRHARLGHPALVVGPQRQEAPDERSDAEQGRHGRGERRLVQAARSGDGRQGRAGRVHERASCRSRRRRISTSARRAATTAAAAGPTGTT